MTAVKHFAAVFGIIRGYGFLGYETFKSNIVALNFLIMCFVPFVFFSKGGRERAGFKKLENPIWFLWGTAAGGLMALTVFLIGYYLFDQKSLN